MEQDDLKRFKLGIKNYQMKIWQITKQTFRDIQKETVKSFQKELTILKFWPRYV